MRAGSFVVCLVAVAAFIALPARAMAFGMSGLTAPLEASPQAQQEHVTKVGGCGWKCSRPVTPQYFRYPPPTVAVRCFMSPWGDVVCPYGQRPPWWRGCWMDDTGRTVCQKDGYFW